MIHKESVTRFKIMTGSMANESGRVRLEGGLSLEHHLRILSEELGDGLAVVRATDRLANHSGHVHDLELALALGRLLRVGNRVGDH